MLHFTRDYYVHEGEVYKKLKPCNNRYYLTNKEGKRKWITKKEIEKILNEKERLINAKTNNIQN